MLHWARVPTRAQRSVLAHVPPIARRREVKLSRCGGKRPPLPAGEEPLAPHRPSDSQRMAKLPPRPPPRHTHRGSLPLASAAGAGGVGTRRPALIPGDGPEFSPRQVLALRGGSQERITGAENKAPPLGKAG
jgi:hypothetical protein